MVSADFYSLPCWFSRVQTLFAALQGLPPHVQQPATSGNRCQGFVGWRSFFRDEKMVVEKRNTAPSQCRPGCFYNVPKKNKNLHYTTICWVYRNPSTRFSSLVLGLFYKVRWSPVFSSGFLWLDLLNGFGSLV